MQLSAMEDGGMQVAADQPSVEANAARNQMKALLQRAIESLPETERRVYELRDVEELGGAETAAELHISPAAMKSRLHRARANIRRYMDAALNPSSTCEAS